MRTFDLGNGHTITVEKTNMGNDIYKITYYEDGRKLSDKYGDKDYIEWFYDVTF